MSQIERTVRCVVESHLSGLGLEQCENIKQSGRLPVETDKSGTDNVSVSSQQAYLMIREIGVILHWLQGGTNHAVVRCFKLGKSEQNPKGQPTDPSKRLQSGSGDNTSNRNKKWTCFIASSSILRFKYILSTYLKISFWHSEYII